MAFKNFKFETDADGIALVTWDIPGRSMNVLDETSVNELEAIVKQTTEDAAIKGVVITSSKEAFCAGADLSMLEGMSKTYADLLKQKSRVRIRIEVHTEATTRPQDAAAAVNLSDQRANVIRNYLLSKGVEGDRIATAGYGGKRPIAPADTPQNQAKNRRVELIVLDQ